MREAEKKRLVKLIAESDSVFAEKYQGKVMSHINEVFEFIADYLLENGVIVPPCKIGQTVYRIVKMSTGVTTAIIKQFIRSVTVTKNNFIDCCENFGKTVFASEAEAKYALKNRRSVSLINGHIEE